MTTASRRIIPLVSALGLLAAGCATTIEGPSGPTLPRDMAHRPGGQASTPWPTTLDERELRTRVGKLLPANVKERAGWSADLQAAYSHLKIPHASETYCAAIAVIEQESSFQVDPAVPGLPDIIRHELERRADKYGIPMLLISAALLKASPNGRSYGQRIDALKTEKQINELYQDMIGELPFGRQLLADYNPVRTAGPMQVSIDFAEQHARDKPYPYAIEKTLRDEVFTRRGGLYFGSAILLDYPAPYDEIVFRFADFNAGRYSSRNAAFQAALGRVAGKSVTLDGDLLRYENGKPSEAPSSVESTASKLAGPLQMSAADIRRDLLLEKTPAFEQSPLFTRVFALADKATGAALPRQAIPTIDLKSPKITRKLTTEWFAKRVEERYRNCLMRADGAARL
jgi:hypothetical protein